MTRQCGECTLCCKLVPVKEIAKPANTKCLHQRRTGCSIYQRRPFSCAMWACRWLVDDDATALARPDRSHYVVDVLPDYVTMSDDQTGQEWKIPVVQVWIDPKHPDAHRDPALREYLERRSEAALVRNPNGTIFLAPPAMTGKGWVEKDSNCTAEPEHTREEINAVIDEMTQPMEREHNG